MCGHWQKEYLTDKFTDLKDVNFKIDLSQHRAHIFSAVSRSFEISENVFDVQMEKLLFNGEIFLTKNVFAPAGSKYTILYCGYRGKREYIKAQYLS